MAYAKDKILQQCIDQIKANGITFFTDLENYVEPALSTLYEWELEKSEAIKKELAKNRIERKAKMRKKWEDSDNATLQVAAYKLLASDDELERLSVTVNRGSLDLGLTWKEERTYETKPEAN